MSRKSSVATSREVFTLKSNLEDWKLNNALNGDVACAMKTLQPLGGFADKRGVLTEVATSSVIRARGVVWSPDGDYLLVTQYYAGSYPQYRIYEFNGNSLSLVSSLVLTEGRYGVFWQRPKVLFSTLTNLSIGNFENRTLSVVANLDTSARYSVAASNRQYVGDGRINTPYFKLWKRNGESLSYVASATSNGNVVRAIAFSPCGKYVVTVASYTSSSYKTIALFSVGSDTLSYKSGINDVSTYSVSFHPAGTYFIVHTSTDMRVYKIVNDALSLVYTVAGDTENHFSPICPIFSSDGKYVAVCNNDSTYPYVFLYRFEGGALTLLGQGMRRIATAVRNSFSPDGRYLAVTNYDTVDPAKGLQVFRID